MKVLWLCLVAPSAAADIPPPAPSAAADIPPPAPSAAADIPSPVNGHACLDGRVPDPPVTHSAPMLPLVVKTRLFVCNTMTF